MLCLFVKFRRHSSCALWPSDTTTVWPRSLLALLMVSLPLWLTRQSSHLNQGPLHTLRTAPGTSRKADCEIYAQNGFPPTAQSSVFTHTQSERSEEADKKTERLHNSHMLSDDSLHVCYSHETVASSINTAVPVITNHHLKSTKFYNNYY